VYAIFLPEKYENCGFHGNLRLAQLNTAHFTYGENIAKFPPALKTVGCGYGGSLSIGFFAYAQNDMFLSVTNIVSWSRRVRVSTVVRRTYNGLCPQL